MSVSTRESLYSIHSVLLHVLAPCRVISTKSSRDPVPDLLIQQNNLFDCHGFCQIAGLIYIASASDGDVISKQLQRYNLEHREEQLGCGWYVEHMIDKLRYVRVTFYCYGNHAA